MRNRTTSPTKRDVQRQRQLAALERQYRAHRVGAVIGIVVGVAVWTLGLLMAWPLVPTLGLAIAILSGLSRLLAQRRIRKHRQKLMIAVGAV
jgi:hypothetical protein